MILGSKLEKFQERFPERLFDVGIAEQHATTMSAGLATQGMKPFLVIYSTFLQRAYDQLVHDVCRQNLNVAFGIDRAGLVGADGGETHQGVFDIAFLRHLPNMVIMMPKDENECQHMVYTATNYDSGPIAVRFPRGNGLGVPMDASLSTIPIGKWEVLKKGADAVILTFGTTIEMALAASENLQKQGIHVEVINARFIKPLDETILHERMQKNIPILTLEEAVLKGGFGSAVLEFAEENNYHPYIKRMGIPDRYIEQGEVDQLLEEINLTKDQIITEINQLLLSSNDKQKRA
ncbi:1-deoxy-D-xylulose 5-phosphate synthase [Gracilibacillus boraciitolerans JCM 21714]|uniref:1-deoxy-D-xylulose-5-phosphate synthase n=1 Tax=Gracilibacillus boraciitolerans JCM 21714 TaxID=1298598 RepID=W4VDJ6_9BACI|nr:1-deoxy-D-xylulose 5-phosphate synthase [Gracilibacillus boraciitolerans JCM 21714]